MRRIIYLFLLITLTVLNLEAQTLPKTRFENDQQIAWFRYAPRVTFGAKNAYTLAYEADARYFLPEWDKNLFIHRLSIGKQLPDNLEIAFATAWFKQHSNDPLDSTQKIRNEIRPQVDIWMRSKLKKVNIQHRYRTEWRNFERIRKDGSTFWQSSHVRFRYQLQAEYNLGNLNKSLKKTSVLGSGELLVNFGPQNVITANLFDQWRYAITVRQTITPTTNIEANFTKWYQQTNTVISEGLMFFNRDNFRLTLSQRFDYKKKQKEIAK